MTTTDSGAAKRSPRNPPKFTERVNVTMDHETRQRMERLRDMLPTCPSASQVVRYAIRELYYRECVRDYGELPPFTERRSQ
jgi:hypothetical protein